MSTLPEALRLADALTAATGQTDAEDDVIHVARWFVEDAAAELRRLHQFAEDQIGRATAAEAALQMTKATHALKLAAVERQRDALLEALQEYVNHDLLTQTKGKMNEKARAAIKAVEEAK